MWVWGLSFLLLLSSISANAQISEASLERVFNAFHIAYQFDLAATNSTFSFNEPQRELWWSLEGNRASYAFYQDPISGRSKHSIFIFGGYARLEGMTEEGVVWTLCHEVGHGFGGPPYKEERQDLVSIEPQADYYSTNICVPKVLKLLPTNNILPPSSYARRLCRKQKNIDRNDCYRGFKAIEGARLFFRLDKNIQTETFFEVKDPGVVSETRLGNEYPTAQCRLDTLVAGLLKEERPLCWYYPGTINFPMLKGIYSL